MRIIIILYNLMLVNEIIIYCFVYSAWTVMKHKNIAISHLASKLPDVLSALSSNKDLCQRLEIQGTCTYSVVIINAVNIVCTH